VMAGLNSVLSGKLQGQFVTAAYLFLDPQAKTGTYSAAGHPPLLHYRAADQSIHDVVENGLILGVMPYASYETRALTLESGDRFLLYTDGVLEADQRGEEFGETRVKHVFSQALSADQVCAALGKEVSAWSRGVAGDDVTIVAVEIT
jgi:sigma-B regulation protein RsbU (phosphoserine phosphatase)